MEKERISRRHFLLLAANAGLYGGAAVILGKRLYPFTGLLSEQTPRSIGPESFKDLIETRDTEIFVIVENSEEHRRLSLNKDAFSKALFDVAKYMFPDDGPERLYAVLERRPLKVTLDTSRSEPVRVGNNLVYPFGEYTPYNMGGPEIKFMGDYLQGYRSVQINMDVMGQTAYDQTVWHEIVHLMQDLKNPFRHSIVSFPYRVKELGAFMNIVDYPDQRQLPTEIEASDVSASIAESNFDSFYATGDYQEWPFGRFFIFSQLQ